MVNMNIQDAAHAQSQIDALLPEKLASQDALSSTEWFKSHMGQTLNISGEKPILIHKENMPAVLGQLFRKAFEVVQPEKINTLIDRITYAKPALSEEQFDTLMASALSKLNDIWGTQENPVPQITSTLHALKEKLEIQDIKKQRFQVLQKIANDVLRRPTLPSDPMIQALAASTTPELMNQALSLPSSPEIFRGRKLSSTIRETDRIYEQKRSITKIALGTIAIVVLALAGTYIAQPTGEGRPEIPHTVTAFPSDLVASWERNQAQIMQREQHLLTTFPPLLQETYTSYDELSQAFERAEALFEENEEVAQMAAQFWTNQEMGQILARTPKTREALENQIFHMESQMQNLREQAEYLHTEFESLQDICSSSSHLEKAQALSEQIHGIYTSKIPLSKKIDQLREVEKQCDRELDLVQDQYKDVVGLRSYATEHEQTLKPLAPTSADLSKLEERAMENCVQAEKIRELAATLRAFKETQKVKDTAKKIVQTAELVHKGITEQKAATASRTFIELMKTFPVTQDNEKVLSSIKHNIDLFKKSPTPEEAAKLGAAINTDIEILQSRHDLYNAFSDTSQSFQQFNNIQLNDMALPYTNAAEEWSQSVKEAKELWTRAQKTASQALPPKQEGQKAEQKAPLPPTVQELDKNLEELRLLLGTVQDAPFKPSFFVGLFTQAQESFGKLQQAQKEKLSPNQIYELFKETKQTLQSTLDQLNRMAQTISEQSEQCTHLVNTTAASYSPGTLEWDKALKLATKTKDLLNTQPQILHSSELINQYLEHTKQMLEEYTSFKQQFKEAWGETSESWFNSAATTIASRIKGLWQGSYIRGKIYGT